MDENDGISYYNYYPNMRRLTTDLFFLYCKQKDFCLFFPPIGLVSLNTLTLLAYERYVVVCRPMAGFKLNVRRSSHGLLLVWLFCLFWAVAPLLGWSSYGPEGVQTSCSLGWEERSWSNYSYLILYTLLCFILPVIIIIYCYSKVLAYMKKVPGSASPMGRRRVCYAHTY